MSEWSDFTNQIDRTNKLLNKLCKENDFIYISNSNITPSYLSEDGSHLNDIGNFKLGDNFFKHVNVSGSFLNARNAWLPISDRILVHKKSNSKMQKVDTEPYLSANSLSNQSDALTQIRIKNPKQLINAHLNINSLRNKFDQLKILVQDILMVTESKLDDTFPDSQFHIPGYKVPFPKDRNKLGGWIIVFVRDDISCKNLDVRIPEDIEALILEIHLRHAKWLFCGYYHPPSQNDAYFLSKFKQLLRSVF